MATFFVIFDKPVVDQPDHPRRARQVEGLEVAAPNANAACFHAARVTRGDGTPTAVYDAEGKIVWGAGPESIVIPDPPAPLSDGTGEPDIPITGEQTLSHA